MVGLLSVLVGLGAVVGVLYVLWQPRWVVVLLLVMFPLEQLMQSYFPFLIENREVFNYFVAGVALVAVLLVLLGAGSLFGRRRPSRKDQPGDPE